MRQTSLKMFLLFELPLVYCVVQIVLSSLALMLTKINSQLLYDAVKGGHEHIDKSIRVLYLFSWYSQGSTVVSAGDRESAA